MKNQKSKNKSKVFKLQQFNSFAENFSKVTCEKSKDGIHFKKSVVEKIEFSEADCSEVETDKFAWKNFSPAANKPSSYWADYKKQVMHQRRFQEAMNKPIRPHVQKIIDGLEAKAKSPKKKKIIFIESSEDLQMSDNFQIFSKSKLIVSDKVNEKLISVEENEENLRKFRLKHMVRLRRENELARLAPPPSSDVIDLEQSDGEDYIEPSIHSSDNEYVTSGIPESNYETSEREWNDEDRELWKARQR